MKISRLLGLLPMTERALLCLLPSVLQGASARMPAYAGGFYAQCAEDESARCISEGRWAAAGATTWFTNRKVLAEGKELRYARHVVNNTPSNYGRINCEENLMEKRLMNVNELSNYLSLPKESIYTMVSLRKLPGVVRLGRALRFEKMEIDEWVSARVDSQATAQGRK
jgi:excisionase family DNA binding protein